MRHASIRTRFPPKRQTPLEFEVIFCVRGVISPLLANAYLHLNMVPSDKAMNKERESLHELTNGQQCFKPEPELIGEINQQLRGWANHFSIGYPRAAYREIDWYVRERLIQHLQRRSQRGFEFPKDRTIFQWFEEQGLIALSGCEAKRHIL
jgi:hypothetical protein